MPSEICFCIVPSPKPSARRAGSHGQWGAGDRPRSRWSIGHCVCHEKTGYLECPNDVNRFVQRVPQILSDPDLHHRPPIFPRHYLGEDQSACRRATGGCPEGAAATARAATEATTSLLPSRSSPPPLWAEQLRLHAAMGLIWIVGYFRRTVTNAQQSGLWIQKTRKQLIIYSIDLFDKCYRQAGGFFLVSFFGCSSYLDG